MKSLTFLTGATVFCLTGAVHASGSEARMVAFFPVETQVCPSGWTEYQPAKGYLIRGSNNTALIGKQVGDPIADARAPEHYHQAKGTLPLREASYRVFSGPHSRVSSVSVPFDGWTSSSDGGMSYVQYLTCQEDTPRGDEPSLAIFLPRHSVQWFSGASCPTGWEVYQPLVGGQGRTILPLPRDAVASSAGAVVDGETADQNHDHQMFFNLPDETHNIKLMVSTSDDPYIFNPFLSTTLANSSPPGVERLTQQGTRSDPGVRNTDVLVPYTYLRPCVKTSNTVNIAELPAGMGSFTTGFSCPTGLNSATSANGRFPLGLPPRRPGEPEPQSGTAFGAAPLKSEQRPSHLHHLDLPVKLETWDLDTTTFLPTGHASLLAPAASKLEGDTDTAPITFPYVQLRFCRVPG